MGIDNEMITDIKEDSEDTQEKEFEDDTVTTVEVNVKNSLTEDETDRVKTRSLLMVLFGLILTVVMIISCGIYYGFHGVLAAILVFIGASLFYIGAFMFLVICAANSDE